MLSDDEIIREINGVDNAASAPLTNLWVSLHTASPGVGEEHRVSGRRPVRASLTRPPSRSLRPPEPSLAS